MKFQARNKTVAEEESDTSNSSDSNEEGEVEPSEDELTNVRFSESDTATRTPKPSPQKDKSGPTNIKNEPRPGPSGIKNEPKPGPSGTGKCGPPVAPLKSKDKKHKLPISPIKFPGNSPTKNSEDVPLSKLIKGSIKPPAISDA